MLTTAPVDFYCERIREGFAAEPLNLLTGLALLAVGLWAYRRGPQAEDRRAAAALALVGLASAAQHGAGLALTVTADIAANLLYLFLLGVLILRRLAGLGQPAALAGAALALTLAYTAVRRPEIRAALGPASDLFFLQAAVLVAAALALLPRHPASARRILVAAIVLMVALPFRVLDTALCEVWPYGTHALWHLLNAGSAALLLAALARHGRFG